MPGKFHGQRSLAGYSPWVAKSQTRQCAQMHVLCCSVAKKARHARNEAAGRSDTRSSPGPGLSVPCVDSCSGIGLPVPCTRAGESVCSLAGRAPATLASDLPEHVSPSPTLGLHPCQSLPDGSCSASGPGWNVTTRLPSPGNAAPLFFVMKILCKELSPGSLLPNATPKW